MNMPKPLKDVTSGIRRQKSKAKQAQSKAKRVQAKVDKVRPKSDGPDEPAAEQPPESEPPQRAAEPDAEQADQPKQAAQAKQAAQPKQAARAKQVEPKADPKPYAMWVVLYAVLGAIGAALLGLAVGNNDDDRLLFSLIGLPLGAVLAIAVVSSYHWAGMIEQPD
jgi:hypothetical protein